ncbi:MAG: hypothetical protein PHD95_00810 [Candidatus ainarchaeum sp.]|nr:hypothetical protein [Candidatus ainarchaeum sp.]
MKNSPAKQKNFLFSYVIDHDGDPDFVGKKLVLGTQNCKAYMRPLVHKNDWIIATLGKKFPTGKTNSDFTRANKDYWQYLICAMQATENPKRGKIYSNNFYVFFAKPVKLKSEKSNFLALIKRGRRHKKIPLETKKVQKFLSWIKHQKHSRGKTQQAKTCNQIWAQ